ncbi:MAG: hypothetical protein M1820_002057 [Bogoriella megaspora]|nr:MAG: hypothetical protein M1820_002057 [Bogoriella megaspora]
MSDFKLSASLPGHDDDVRSVAFPSPNLVLSASRDATVRQWKLIGANPPKFDPTLSSHGSAFINAVAFVPPSSEYPEGLIVSGGKDAIIDVRQPDRTSEDNAEALLLGHASNVCALSVSEDGRFIVSGSWDSEARIWQVGKWDKAIAVLQGHQASVWGVLAYDQETIITASADKTIRTWHPSGKLLRTIGGGSDVVRTLCKLPSNHATGANFASAGNDGIITLWTLNGRQVAQLYGHESFIYNIATLPTGELVSSSEDRTARIWKDNQCVQTITHPAISVWSVAVCPDSGDIATGTSDRIVRIFTRSQDRLSDEEALRAFEESVKASSIPQQQVGDINKEQLPGPEFLQQKSGTKEGQVQMIREPNGNVSAHQWSNAAQQWVNVGTVVDSAGSSGRKQEFQGQDYDYVFDVDIEDGKPPLKLPFNLSQNPYEVARKFIADNELPVSYLDQVANFIVSNTQGATIGQSAGSTTQTPGSDPWGSESRYRPGEVGAPASSTSRPKVLPQTQYLEIVGNLKAMQKKIQEFNQGFLESGAKENALNPSGLTLLASVIQQLDQAKSSSKLVQDSPALEEGIELAIKLATSWPPEKRLPGIDLLSALARYSPLLVTSTSSNSTTIIDTLSEAFAQKDQPNQAMLAIRAIANLFNTEQGRLIMDGEFDKIHELLAPFLAEPSKHNRNLIIAITTVFINYTVLLSSSSSASASDPPAGPNADRALTLLDDTTKVINSTKDSETMYRALVAAGTLLTLGEDFRSAAREVFDFEKALSKAESTVKEPRIRDVVKEIKDELGSS